MMWRARIDAELLVWMDWTDVGAVAMNRIQRVEIEGGRSRAFYPNLLWDLISSK